MASQKLTNASKAAFDTNHLGWKRLLLAEGWAPRPRGTSWVGISTTSAEDEIETQEEPSLPIPLICPSFRRARPWLQAGYDPSFPAGLSHHQELGQVPQDPVLMLLLPSSTRGCSREGSELGWPMPPR